ncbi:hypothetical protein TSUD_164170 [Trifolium subterraneum]|uniref:Cytochrome P450 n=1 Tax=Trifolium subterraneum TaxID=3900 RepID=A0A2Z6M249_TRISU|nr:hypothetical protein TSUD_164170 [Trifolium subterraneum]
MPCLRGLDLDGHEKIIKKACKIMKKYHDPIIDDRIHEWKKGKKTYKEDLLDVLISLKYAHKNDLLTTHEIKSNLLELTLAAVDNPSNAVEWGLAEMINQPELLKKAIEELYSIVGKERMVQEYDFPKLNYVKACAREAFRRHPICDFNLPHVAMKDTVVSNYFIPKERRLKIDGSNLSLTDSSLEFVTFGTGRRGCSGIMLGSSMTIMLFARLLHGFTWSVPPNQSSIDLSESHGGTTKAKPLVAVAKPRLPIEAYRLY